MSEPKAHLFQKNNVETQNEIEKTTEALSQHIKNNTATQVYNNNVIDQRKRKRDNNMQLSAASKQLRNNYYSVLDWENDCDSEQLKEFQQHVQEQTTKRHKPNSENENNQNKTFTKSIEMNTENTSGASTSNCSTKIPNKVDNDISNKKQKIPPINIFDIESNNLIGFIKNGLKISDFKLKVYKHKKSIFLNSLKDFMRVKAYLEKVNAKFFTYTPKGIKNKTYLLKGLEADLDVQIIFEDLCRYESEDLQFLKIAPFTTRKSVQNSEKLPIYMVQLSPDSNVNKLKTITGIQHRCVKWEHLKRPEISQCRNCQGFFHSAANCYLPSKCVKCNEKHEKGKCGLKEGDQIYCVLCKEYGHPASFKGCKAYKDLHQKLKQKRQIFTENRQTPHNNIPYVQNGATYAQMARGSNFPPTDNQLNIFIQEVKTMMVNLTNQFANIQKQLQIQTTRIDTIFSLMEI